MVGMLLWWMSLKMDVSEICRLSYIVHASGPSLEPVARFR